MIRCQLSPRIGHLLLSKVRIFLYRFFAEFAGIKRLTGFTGDLTVRKSMHRVHSEVTQI